LDAGFKCDKAVVPTDMIKRSVQQISWHVLLDAGFKCDKTVVPTDMIKRHNV
jgi:hypothetical protein